MELGIEDEEEGKLLNLTLSLAGGETDSKTRKRKKNITTTINDHLSTSHGHSDTESSARIGILQVLQVRDRMSKPENERLSQLDQEDKKKGLHLIHLLLKSASSVEENNFISSTASLINLYQNSLQTGDSAQRVAYYFADGLIARLISEKSPFYETVMKHPTPAEEFLAFTHLYRVSPCYQFTHFTANQIILEAFEREEGKNKGELHVIDLDLAYGFQWPSLIQSLSEKATVTNPISLHITGFAKSSEELAETETRLASFSNGFGNIAFRFQGLLRGPKTIINHLVTRKRKNETVAVNLVSHLTTSNNIVLTISDILRAICSVNPSVVVLVQREGSDDHQASPLFLSTFTECLHFHAAMFDSLHDFLPRDSLERMSIEKNHLGYEIRQAMVSSSFGKENTINCYRYESLESWKERMEQFGFSGIELSSRTIMQAKLLLRMRSHNHQPMSEGDYGGGFRVFERDNKMAMSLGWQDRILLTVTSWQCVCEMGI